MKDVTLSLIDTLQVALRNGVREKRGSSGSKLIFNWLIPFPCQFGEDFLNNSENKEAVNIFLANTLTKLHKNDEQIFVVTQHDTIISNTRSTFSEELILYCNTEEADAKLIRHCINLADQGYKHIVLRTVDSDVLVLMLAYSHVMLQSGAITIYVQFGVGIYKKYYNIINLSEKIGLKNCLGLPFFMPSPDVM